jgi:tetratricopeptide (TPR) repeat protein
MFDLRGQHVTTQYNAEHITTVQGISEERHERLAAELGVTRSALTSFFKILEQQQVPPEDLDHTLRQIATSYKELHARLQRFTSDDPAVAALKEQARDAIEAGEFARAEALLNEASAKDLEVAQELRETVATRLCSAAASRATNGDLKRTQLAYAEAAAYYQQAVELLESVPMANLELAAYLNAWGIVSYEAGQYPAAELLYQRALALWEQVLGPTHPEVATSLNNLAGLYQAQGRYAKAEPLYQRALAIREHSLAPLHPHIAQSLDNLAVLYRAQGRHDKAEPLCQQALTIRERVFGPMHSDVATSLSNLALLYHDQGRYAEAEPLYRRALALYGSLAPPVRNFTRRGNLGVYKAINGLIFLFSQPSCPERHDGIDFRTLCFYMDLECIVNFCSVGARDPSCPCRVMGRVREWARRTVVPKDKRGESVGPSAP